MMLVHTVLVWSFGVLIDAIFIGIIVVGIMMQLAGIGLIIGTYWMFGPLFDTQAPAAVGCVLILLLQMLALKLRRKVFGIG